MALETMNKHNGLLKISLRLL